MPYPITGHPFHYKTKLPQPIWRHLTKMHHIFIQQTNANIQTFFGEREIALKGFSVSYEII
jgi:hypothetical protein